MKEIEIEKVMDRQKIANTIHGILDVGMEMLTKEKLEPSDREKIKVMRSMGTHVNAAVTMVQQESFQLKAALVAERMRSLGYEAPKVIEG